MLEKNAAEWVMLAARSGVQVHHAGVHSDAGANWRHWMLMVTAMMLPLQIQGVGRAAERSICLRRHLASLSSLRGDPSVWAVASVPLALRSTSARISHRSGVHDRTGVGIVLA